MSEAESLYMRLGVKKLQISGHQKDPRPIVLAEVKLNNTLNIGH